MGPDRRNPTPTRMPPTIATVLGPILSWIRPATINPTEKNAIERANGTVACTAVQPYSFCKGMRKTLQAYRFPMQRFMRIPRIGNNIRFGSRSSAILTPPLLSSERMGGVKMAHERLPNTMLFPILGILMNLCMGNLYAWSVFRIPLQKLYGWTAVQATVPFQLSIAFFAVAMVLAGRIQDKVGPRNVAMIGGILVGAGFILSS